MKKVSAGTIIVNEFCEILMGRVTNSDPQIWDLPKGIIEVGEYPCAAAVRECQEEFNLILDRTALYDLGMCKYNREKNIWLFITYMKKSDVDMSSLSCNTTFFDRYSKKDIKEVDAYAWVSLKNVHYECCPSMVRLLSAMSDKIENECKYGEYRYGR